MKETREGLPKALHAYWRYDYAKIVNRSGGKNPKDPFAGLKTATPSKCLIVKKGKTSCLLLNKFPYAPGHLLAVPYRGVADLENLTKEESAELLELITLGQVLLKRVLEIPATNIGLNQGEGRVSGGSVPQHLHWHIIPRWWGDTSFFPIMSGGVRVLLRSQRSVWEGLMKELKAMEKAPKAKKRKTASKAIKGSSAKK